MYEQKQSSVTMVYEEDLMLTLLLAKFLPHLHVIISAELYGASMSLQDVFYLVGIIYMVLIFLMLIGTVVALFVIKNKVTAVQKNIKENVYALKNIRGNKFKLAEDTGMLLAGLTSSSKLKSTKVKRKD